MIKVGVEQIRLPDWGWHLDDREESVKLTSSMLKHGQLTALLVREVEPLTNQIYEVVDGRRRLGIAKQLGWSEVWVLNKGDITREEAIKLALSLELSAEVDYAAMAQAVTSLDEGYTSLPMTTPYTAERLRYFRELVSFDWSQYSGGQGALFDDEDAPAPTPKPAVVTQAPVVAKTVARPTAPRPVTATTANDAAARLASRALFSQAVPDAAPPVVAPVVTPVLAALDSMIEFVEAKGIKASDTTPIIFSGDDSPRENTNWRPEPPPCLDGIDEVEIDTETTGLRWWERDRPIGISLRLPDGRRQYLPWGHTGGNLDEGVVKEWARRELRGKRLTGANIRFDNHMLYQWGVDLEEQDCQLADVQHYAALLDEYRKEYGLDVLAKDFLGEQKTGEDLDKTRMASYHASQVADYACQDVHLVGGLKNAMLPLMEAQDLGRVRQLECDVIYPVCEMERNAAYVNRAKLREWVQESARALDAMLSEVAREVGFQVNSDKNSDMVRLFEHLKLHIPGRTAPSTKFPDGQASFADHLISQIDNPIVQLVRRSGKLASLRSKFLVSYDKVVGNDNKLRFALHQLRGDEYGTARGRFSMAGSSRGIGQFGANLQQVFRVNSQREAFGFKHDDSSHDHEIFLVRSLFEAEPYVRWDGSDAEYLSADAQSIEYRIAAHIAEATKLIDAYQADFRQLEEGRLTDKWVDFHRVVGDVIRPYKDLSRNIIKNANFCLVYGGQEATLARTLGVSGAEADQIYRVWHRMFPELSQLPKKAEALARGRGYVKTLLGRRARFTTAEHMQWAHAAINYVIQGSAADVMKTKLVELHRARKWTGLLLRQTVHDEADGDARMPETVQRVREILNHQSFKTRVPIVWEVETGKNWAVAH